MDQLGRNTTWERLFSSIPHVDILRISKIHPVESRRHVSLLSRSWRDAACTGDISLENAANGK